MSMALPGLATGMNTTDLVNQLMQIERIPQQQLLARASSADRYAEALRGLNSQIAAFGETAKDASATSALQVNNATSSQESVVAVASTDASAGELSFDVSAVAARHTVVSAAMEQWGSETFEYTDAEGNSHSIEAAGSSIQDIAAAINRSDQPLTATAVSAGDGTYRLQVAAAETGEANNFTIVGAESTVVTEGSDAEVVLWAGTGAEQRVTSSTNTFSDLVQGVDVSVSAVTTDVSIAVERDTDAAVETVSSLVNEVQSIFAQLRSSTSVSGEGDAVSGSILTGDSTARTAQNRLQQAMIAPIEGESLSAIGIEISRHGELTLDEDKLREALDQNPAKVEEMFASLATRAADTATSLSDRYDGLITSRITGQENNVRRMEDQAERMETRLDMRRRSLERTYAQLEVSIQRMNSEMEYLQGQLGSLPTNQMNN